MGERRKRENAAREGEGISSVTCGSLSRLAI
jgi:hypothetical protein